MYMFYIFNLWILTKIIEIFFFGRCNLDDENGNSKGNNNSNNDDIMIVIAMTSV